MQYTSIKLLGILVLRMLAREQFCCIVMPLEVLLQDSSVNVQYKNNCGSLFCSVKTVLQ